MTAFAMNYRNPYEKTGIEMFAESFFGDPQRGVTSGPTGGAHPAISGMEMDQALQEVEDRWVRLSDGEKMRWEERAQDYSRKMRPQDYGYGSGGGSSGYGGPSYGFRGRKRNWASDQERMEPPSEQEVLEALGPEAFQANIGEGQTRNLSGSIQAKRQNGKITMTNARSRRERSGGLSGNSRGNRSETGPGQAIKDGQAWMREKYAGADASPVPEYEVEYPARSVPDVPVNQVRGNPQARPPQGNNPSRSFNPMPASPGNRRYNPLPWWYQG